MEYKKFNNKYIVRIDKGEEIIEKLTELCEKENIKLGTIHGLGATNKVKIGLFKTESKKYKDRELTGDYEITPLYGNISTMEGKPYLHCHINLSDEKHNSFGGHLNCAIVSATFEAVVEKIDGQLERKFNEEVGLNLYKFK